MTIFTDYLIEDTVSFFLLAAVIALFWFHPWHVARVKPRSSGHAAR